MTRTSLSRSKVNLQGAGAYYGGHPHSLVRQFFRQRVGDRKIFFPLVCGSCDLYGLPWAAAEGGTIAALELDSWSRQNSKPPVEITAGIIRGAGDVCAPMFERFEAS